MTRQDASHLARRTFIALLICTALVALCYFFIDRPVAWFVHDEALSENRLFLWLTLPPPILQSWTPAVLAMLAILRAFRPLRQSERALLASCIAIIVADQCRESLAYCFGRYWPETWTHDNPSYIKNGEFGFHLFHSGSWYGSFPSGHMARIASLAAVLWIAWPRGRWLGVLCSLAVAVGLLGMNYHFVGDVIAGSFVGGIVGAYAAWLCRAGARTGGSL